MARRPHRAIVVEGPDDVVAVRELLRASEGGGDLKLPPEARRSEAWRAVCDAVDIAVFPALGKSKLPQRAMDALLSDPRPDRIAVCFDPDDQPPDRDLKFFRDADLPLTRRDDRRYLANRRHEAEIIAAAWRAENLDRFAGLDDHHCLERVLIAGLLTRDVGQSVRLADWATTSTKRLLELVRDRGWKRAARIWSAALTPKTDGFVEASLQETEGHCLAALQRTEAARAIVSLLVP